MPVGLPSFLTVLAVALVAFMAGLTPLAYADPPDPTWILGCWDDNDFDDVVGYVTSATALLHTPVTCGVRAKAPQKCLKPTPSRSVAGSIPHTVHSSRAPPTV